MPHQQDCTHQGGALPLCLQCEPCRQQLQAALSVVESGLASLPSESSRDSARVPPTSSCRAQQFSHQHDVLLLRVRAQLLLASADANGALTVLGSAKRRLSSAHALMAARPGSDAASAVLVQQEAQVRAVMSKLCSIACVHLFLHCLQESSDEVSMGTCGG